MPLDCPKISILIPTWNRAHYLPGCIESVLSQDYPDFEIVISDNASSDNTSDVVKKYLNDKRIRYFRNDANIGLAANWEKLLYRYAAGKYGKLLNDDDYLVDKSHLSKAVALMCRHDLDIVFSGSLIQWNNPADNTAGINEIVFDLPEVVSRQWWLEHLGKRQRRLTLFPNLVGGAVFCLQKARELNAFRPGIYGLDYELALKFILFKDSGYLKGHHWAERYHSSDAKTANLDKILEGTVLFNRIYDYGVSIGLPKRKMLRFRQRGQTVFIQNFLIHKWFVERGCTSHSLLWLYKELKKIAPGVFWRMLMTVPTISEILKSKNIKLYHLARTVYSKVACR